MRKGQSKQMTDLLAQVGDMGSTKHPAMIMALWDAVGITHELNGFRNDAAGRIQQYGKDRELQITAMNAIAGVKQALESRAKTNAEDSFDRPFKWNAARSASRLNNTVGKGYGSEFEANEKELCRLWEKDAAERVPHDIANRRGFHTQVSTAKFQAEMRKIDSDIAANKKARARPEVAELHQSRVKRAIANSWPKYQEKLNGAELKTFKTNFDNFFAKADKLIDDRTDDLIAWLESPSFINALTEFHQKNIDDGVVFDDTIGTAMLGMNSSLKGQAKIDAWVKEMKATETNLVWRTLALNQEEGKAEVEAAMAAAAAQRAPVGQLAVDFLSKHIRKWADMYKKANTMQNTLIKASNAAERIKLIKVTDHDRFFLTVGDRLFRPFLQKGVDTGAEFAVRGLILARAGVEPERILDAI
jgi:hypothetical protein